MRGKSAANHKQIQRSLAQADPKAALKRLFQEKMSFAIGDVASRKYRQVVIAAADGCVAALSADKYINKRTRARYQWAKH